MSSVVTIANLTYYWLDRVFGKRYREVVRGWEASMKKGGSNDRRSVFPNNSNLFKKRLPFFFRCAESIGPVKHYRRSTQLYARRCWLLLLGGRLAFWLRLGDLLGLFGRGGGHFPSVRKELEAVRLDDLSSPWPRLFQKSWIQDMSFGCRRCRIFGRW